MFIFQFISFLKMTIYPMVSPHWFSPVLTSPVFRLGQKQQILILNWDKHRNKPCELAEKSSQTGHENEDVFPPIEICAIFADHFQYNTWQGNAN